MAQQQRKKIGRADGEQVIKADNEPYFLPMFKLSGFSGALALVHM